MKDLKVAQRCEQVKKLAADHDNAMNRAQVTFEATFQRLLWRTFEWERILDGPRAETTAAALVDTETRFARIVSRTKTELADAKVEIASHITAAEEALKVLESILAEATTQSRQT